MKVSSMRCLVLATFALLGLPAVASAQDMQAGSVTGLPVPRYVSLKTDRVNLREGPSKEHRTRWVYQRAGLPMEVTAEFETWRRVRDADGTGYVRMSLGKEPRTVVVACRFPRGAGLRVRTDSLVKLRFYRDDDFARRGCLQDLYVPDTNGKWNHVIADFEGGAPDAY